MALDLLEPDPDFPVWEEQGVVLLPHVRLGFALWQGEAEATGQGGQEQRHVLLSKPGQK